MKRRIKAEHNNNSEIKIHLEIIAVILILTGVMALLIKAIDKTYTGVKSKEESYEYIEAFTETKFNEIFEIIDTPPRENYEQE